MQEPTAGNDNAPGPAPMDEALDWFTRLQSGTAVDRDAFAVWLDADPAHAEAFRRVEAMWNAPAFRSALARHEAAVPDIRHQKPNRHRVWLHRTAAVAAVLLLAVVSVFKGPDLLIAMEADARTAVGERRTVTLADGSRMTLNTAAAAEIDFSDGLRRIRLLKGEAYFDVTPDPARPFEVAAGDARVRVTGTAFLVRIDGDDARVTVAEGRVAVSGRVDASPIELNPGDGIVVAAGHPGTVAHADTDRVLAWLDGRLRFRDRPLGEVLAELDRYHAGWIGAVSDRARTARISGNYSLDDPHAVARALADAASLDTVNVGGLVLMLR